MSPGWTARAYVTRVGSMGHTSEQPGGIHGRDVEAREPTFVRHHAQSWEEVRVISSRLSTSKRPGSASTAPNRPPGFADAFTSLVPESSAPHWVHHDGPERVTQLLIDFIVLARPTTLRAPVARLADSTAGAGHEQKGESRWRALTTTW